MGLDDSEKAAQTDIRQRGRRLRPWLTLGLALFLVLLALVGLGLSGRALPLPGLLVTRIEAKANMALAGQASVRIGAADLVVNDDFLPQVRRANVTLLGGKGQRLATVDDVRAALDPSALLRLDARLARLTVQGARIAVRRAADGSLDIAPGAKSFSGQALSPAQVLDSVDAAFDLPALSGLDRISVTGLSMLIDDRRAGQVWTLSQGALIITQTPDALTGALTFGVEGQSLMAPSAPLPPHTGGPAKALVTAQVETDKHSPAARFSVAFGDASARDLAAQIGPLAWLKVIEAHLSGKMASSFDNRGAFGPLDVALTLGPGALHPTENTRPVPFDGANPHLTYDPARAALDVSELLVNSPTLRADLRGQAWLKGMERGLPDTLVGQIQVADLKADPAGLFAHPITIGQGALDLKLTLDPFALTIGQLTLADQGQKIALKGRIAAVPDGWSVAMDVGMDAIDTGRLLALWPLAAVPNTREWLSENVATGQLFDVKGALRLAPGAEPRFDLSYQFKGANVRFMKTLPPITDGVGYATIRDNAFVLVAEKGRVAAPQGGDLDISGSVLKVPDIRLKPSPFVITLKSRSSVTAALSILDQPPFTFLGKAGLPVDLAEGQAELRSVLKFVPLLKLRAEDVDFDVSGQLLSVRSDKIVKGRRLAADRLTVRALPESLTLSGAATLDGVPLTATWTQGLKPQHKGGSQVTGTVTLSPDALSTFHIDLPQGAVKGLGLADFTLNLAKGHTPAFTLPSDLKGLTLSVPEVAWTKAAASKGELRITGAFDQPVRIDQLKIAAPGMAAEGKITLKPDGSFDLADFSKVAVGDWFEGHLVLAGRGHGKRVALTIAGGRADMKRATFGHTSLAPDPTAPPLDITLDRLRISDAIHLGQFRGRFATEGGLSGDFVGLVNDTAPVTGRMIPADNGRAAFRVQSEDAGLAMAASGLYESGRGGTMDLILRPVGDPGTYDGTLNIRHIRVVKAAGLASILNAVSVVGLINELQGAGIAFTDVSGAFLLTPKAVEIRNGSAIGASMGISGAGVYWTDEGRFDLQGVISPIYLLNGIGQIFSRQRDGLFGFNYTLKGTRKEFKVSVNPLSILTPGMFRDLFRKAPPTIAPPNGG
ncbi:MAG: DUF3971 domain-containing protein [Rhodobacteraceae bacterium]|nr:DUF3971 domain-containing protein [Paracoccaceae bacterium]